MKQQPAYRPASGISFKLKTGLKAGMYASLTLSGGRGDANIVNRGK